MSDLKSIPHGPREFEQLLVPAKLSAREAQAIRSVALSMTAAEAAPIIGVSGSTVGSYRQRAYAKLGVSGRAEFLRLPEVVSWTNHIQELRNGPISSQNDEDRYGGPSCDATCVGQASPSTEEATRTSKIDMSSEGGFHESFSSAQAGKDDSPAKRRPYRKVLVTILIGIIFVIAISFFTHNRSSGDYAERAQGIIASQYGDVPNVVGMRADAAASEIANAGFCPKFNAHASNLSEGTVLSIEKVGSAEDLGTEVICFSWGSGSTGCYEEAGNWIGYVVLAVAV